MPPAMVATGLATSILGPPATAYGAFYAKIDSFPTLNGRFPISATQAGHGIGLDPLARVYLAGDTPGGLMTVSAVQPNFGGGGTDAFVVTIGPDCVVPPLNMVSWWQGHNNTTEIIGGQNC